MKMLILISSLFSMTSFATDVSQQNVFMYDWNGDGVVDYLMVLPNPDVSYKKDLVILLSQASKGDSSQTTWVKTVVLPQFLVSTNSNSLDIDSKNGNISLETALDGQQFHFDRVLKIAYLKSDFEVIEFNYTEWDDLNEKSVISCDYDFQAQKGIYSEGGEVSPVISLAKTPIPISYLQLNIDLNDCASVKKSN